MVEAEGVGELMQNESGYACMQQQRWDIWWQEIRCGPLLLFNCDCVYDRKI